MKQTDFFFTCVVNLRHLSFNSAVKEAMYAVYDACKAINQPNRYGSALQTIIIDAILQDEFDFFKPNFKYNRRKKTLEAGVLVDLDRLSPTDFVGNVQLYQEVIFGVLDQVAPLVKDYDIEGLKRDLAAAIREEVAAASAG